MLCGICFVEMKDYVVGVTNNANEKGKPKDYFILSRHLGGVPLYIEAEKPITKGNNKGNTKATFCVKCGEKII